MKFKILTLFSSASLFFSLSPLVVTSCSENKSPTVIEITHERAGKESFNLEDVETFFVSKVEPASASKDVRWESTDPTVAKVVSQREGVVLMTSELAKVGECDIYAVSTVPGCNVESNHIHITVEDQGISSISVSPNDHTIEILEPSVTTYEGFKARIKPAETQHKTIEWHVRNQNIATIAKDTGKVTLLKAGETTVWAQTPADEQGANVKSNEAQLHIYHKPDSCEIVCDKGEITELKAGQTAKFSITNIEPTWASQNLTLRTGDFPDNAFFDINTGELEVRDITADQDITLTPTFWDPHTQKAVKVGTNVVNLTLKKVDPITISLSNHLGSTESTIKKNHSEELHVDTDPEYATHAIEWQVDPADSVEITEFMHNIYLARPIYKGNEAKTIKIKAVNPNAGSGGVVSNAFTLNVEPAPEYSVKLDAGSNGIFQSTGTKIKDLGNNIPFGTKIKDIFEYEEPTDLNEIGFDHWEDENGHLVLPETEVTKSLNLKAIYYQNKFEVDSWENICGYINEGGLGKLKQAYGINSFIGLKRIVKIDDLKHEVFVIGENADYIANPDGSASDEKTTLTFAFRDNISHGYGEFDLYTSQWYGAHWDNSHYSHSDVFNALNSDRYDVAYYDPRVIGTFFPGYSVKKMVEQQATKEGSTWTNNIKTISKSVLEHGGQGWAPVNLAGKFHLLTLSSMFAPSDVSSIDPLYLEEGNQYEYFKKLLPAGSINKPNPSITTHTLFGLSQQYWLASPQISDTKECFYISKDGNLIPDITVSCNCRLAPIFAI